MIHFDRLRYRNVNGSSNRWTEINLGNGLSTLLVGKNGAGKSTILDAFFFVLTGEPYRKVPKSTIVNSVNKGDLLVDLSLTARGKNYIIRRGIKPNVLEVYQDGAQLMKEAKVTDMQNWIEADLLGFGSVGKTLAQTVVLGSASHIPFMKLPAPHRRLVVEDLLDVSNFGAMAEVTRRLASATKQRVAEAREACRVLEERERGQVALLAATEGQRAIRIAEAREGLQRAQERGLKLFQEHEVTAATLAAATDPEPMLQMYNKTRMKIGEELAEMVATQRGLEAEIIILSSERTCETCGRDLRATDSQKRVDHMGEKLVELVGYIENYRVRLVELAETIKRTEMALADRRSLAHLVDAARDRLAHAMRTQMEAEAKVAAIEDEPAVDAEKIKSEIDATRSETRSIISAAEADGVLLRHYDGALAMLKDSGIKASIVRTYLPLLNGLVNTNLEELDFDARFDLDETFQETIKSRGRDGFRYESFSEGEKKRIDFAILFAWCELARLKNSVSTNLMLFDEVDGGSLDDDAIRDFVKLMRKRVGVTNLVISHHPGFRGLLDREMKAVKKKGFCYLEGGP